MRSGRLDHRITIQRFVTGRSPSGQPTKTWSAIAHKRPASRRTLNGDERYSGVQTVATEQVEFSIRHSAEVAAISPLDRILWPAPSDANVQEPAPHTVFDILAVPEIGRREGFKIVAARRADVR